MDRDVLLGVVIGAQGLRGEVRVKTFTQSPLKLSAYGPLRTANGKSFEIAELREGKGDVAVARFKGIDDRNAAEALDGIELFVPRSALPATDSDEFYHADLVGLSAEDAEGRYIGEIRAIHNFGAGDVIEIARSAGDTVFLSFDRATVPTVDLANRRVIIAEPEDPAALEERGIE